MKTIIIVGMTKTGKTTKAKEILAKFPERKKYIYDVNNEYSEGAKLPKIKDFLVTCSKATQSVLLFEEATIFFKTRGQSDEMTDILVRKRHTNNIVLLNFHSFRAIPTYILELTDYIIIKRTNDTEKRVLQKFESEILAQYFNLVKEGSKKDPYFSVEVAVSDL